MMDYLKYKWQLAVLYAIYSVIVVAVFSPFHFIGAELSVLPLIAQLALFFILIYLTSTYFSSNDERKILLVRTSSDLLVSIIVGLLILMFFGNEYQNALVFLVAYIILPLPVIALRVLSFLMEDLKKKVNVQKGVNESSENGELELLITNDSGKILLTVPFQNVICFEANDNYVVTYYLTEEKELKKSMERISLKKIEDLISDMDYIFHRVHKSYIVNPVFIEKITGRSQAYKLKISYLEDLIPVSRSFDIEQVKP